ncbi:MAG: tRNA (adenosine(37)-N6)-threonylcarbamoyltransferase complex dimerization subunit type 1 TsaB [Thermogutta sp.]|uniref:tRNA (adenosine(37)-N6)-threonylcarbamoyltransferase complex dimerization subunit type 1 TsaB n=1 Tax=Thermogutta sp. TaxID=1962930 RepID=UPI00198E099B|nr:tRNA (adenosine(37)-N6)-threonylcarbamoyltransferase complex dimerization subunit type 1 TsaB [Thermogutta sp.]MBC7352304.1 tRNA (adenosine(37)-N6)-threonylcarbamoyltransferase complex dimerization subunit type 1 TsaB [Thermogutta sp.]
MNILAIETTAVPGSVAVAADGTLLAELRLPESPRAAASLAPTLRDLLQKVDWHPKDVNLVGVTVGPGQFTSVRIGVVSAKTFAYAVGAEILGLNTFDVVAYQTPKLADYLAVIGDAQRGQIVGRAYVWTNDRGWAFFEDSGVVQLQEWLETLGRKGSVAVTGTGLHRFAQTVGPAVTVAPRELWDPTATTVAQLAYQRYQAGERGDVWTLKPIYYRPSYAEEKRASATSGHR